MSTPVKSMKKYESMSNETLLETISRGNLNEKEAIAAATVCEKRFPTPEAVKSIKKGIKK